MPYNPTCMHHHFPCGCEVTIRHCDKDRVYALSSTDRRKGERRNHRETLSGVWMRPGEAPGHGIYQNNGSDHWYRDRRSCSDRRSKK